MTDLFRSGETAQNRGQNVEALQLFLKLREQELDLVDSVSLVSEVRHIQLRDLNRDRWLEIGALTSSGELAVFGLHPRLSRLATLHDFQCKHFRFFRYLEDQPAVIVVRSDGGLSAFSLDSEQRGLKLRNIAKLEVPVEPGAVLDIAYKPQRIYVAAANSKIYAYNALNFQRWEYPLPETVLRLKTGGRAAEAANPILANHMVGLCEGGGLMVFNVAQGPLRTIARSEEKERYIDAILGDPDNDGIDNIIAISVDGKLHIYDWHSLRVKYRHSVPDEFYCVYCDDIDGDGVPEILVGAKSNRIYSFVIALGEIRAKEYEMPHRVSDLWVGDVQQPKTEKRIIAGLANGSLAVFKIRFEREISRSIALACRDFRRQRSPEEQKRVFAESDRPEMVQLGLEELTPEMNCPELLEFLRQIEGRGIHETQLVILSKLPACLKQFQNDSELVQYAVEFVNRLFERQRDLPTCERICATLSRIVEGGADEAMLLLAEYARFNNERLRWEASKVNRVKQIEDWISVGDLASATDELDTLKVLELDALQQSTKLPEGVTFIDAREDYITATTRDGFLRVLNHELSRELCSRHFAEGRLRCCPVSFAAYAYAVCHGRVVELLDHKLESAVRRPYAQRVSALTAFVHRRDLFWAVGLDDGQIIIDSLAGVQAEFRVSGRAVALAAVAQEHSVDLWAATVNGRFYRFRNVTAAGSRTVSSRREQAAVPGFLLPDLNVLDWLRVQDANVHAWFVVVAATGLHMVREDETGLTGSELWTGTPVTCAVLRRNQDSKQMEIVAATRNQHLVFLSLTGKVQKQVYMPGVPTALCVIASGDHSGEILAGSARGHLGYFQVVSKAHLAMLAEKCDKTNEEKRRRFWSRFTLQEKLALIALAHSQPLDLAGIHGKLEGQIGKLIPPEQLLTALRTLEQEGFIQGRPDGPSVHYVFQDRGCAEWVRLRQQIYQTVREHRDDLIRLIGLSDVCGIDAELAGHERQWLFEFLQIEPEKWARLVAMSAFVSQPSQAVDEAENSPRQTQVRRFCDNIQAVFKKSVRIDPPLSARLSAFEIQIPGVRFRGFQRIGVVVQSSRTSLESSAIEWIRGWKNREIVLALVSGGKALMQNALKGSLFSVAVLDEEDLKRILLADAPPEAFLDVVLEQVNISELSPFQYKGPVTEMFYGRTSELRTILNAIRRPGKLNHAVIGPRRIGKTSLLLRAKAGIDEAGEFSTAFLDLSTYQNVDACRTAILRALKIRPDGNDFLSLMEAHCREQKGKVLLFFDEVDGLLLADRSNGHVFTGALRTLINTFEVKIVVAGYKEIYQHMHDTSSPMFNIFSAIELAGLDHKEAFDLIEEPFRNVYRIDSESVRSIIEKTAGYPNFIQCCCSLLIKQGSVKARRTIQRPDVDDVIGSPDLYDYMIGTYLENLDQPCRILLYLMVAAYDKHLGKIIIDRAAYEQKTGYAATQQKYVLGESFTPYELHRLLEVHQVYLSQSQLEVLIRKLVLASVLRHEPGGTKYSFVLPDLPLILRNHVEIELRAVNLLEEMSANAS